MHSPQQAHLYYDSARVLLEDRIRKFPNDERMHGSLGIAYAGLGKKEDAIREAKRGVELLPVSREAIRGAYRVEELAETYAMVGEYDLAVTQLELLLSAPGEISVPLLRLDPAWSPLRGNLRFQKLIAGNK